MSAKHGFALIGFIHPVGSGASFLTPLFLRRGKFWIQELTDDDRIGQFRRTLLRGYVMPAVGKEIAFAGDEGIFAFYAGGGAVFHGTKDSVSVKLRGMMDTAWLSRATRSEIAKFVGQSVYAADASKGGASNNHHDTHRDGIQSKDDDAKISHVQSDGGAEIFDLRAARTVRSPSDRIDVVSNELELVLPGAADAGTAWLWFKQEKTPCLTQELILEFRGVVARIAGLSPPPNRLVVAARDAKTFSFGEDLELMLHAALKGRRDKLTRYVVAHIDAIYAYTRLASNSLETIALVDGTAFGFGFEIVLASQVIIAEETARFGFPEVLMNLFPVCGFSLLTRRIGLAKAQEIVKSGMVYSASELHDLGIVDVVAKSGHGELTAGEYIGESAGESRGFLGRFRNATAVDIAELREIAAMWIDGVLGLSQRDLRMMARLRKAQEKVRGEPSESIDTNRSAETEVDRDAYIQRAFSRVRA